MKDPPKTIWASFTKITSTVWGKSSITMGNILKENFSKDPN